MSESTNQTGESKAGPAGASPGSAADDVRQAFGALPLDLKISTLIQVEMDMLGDAVKSVVSAVSKVVDDVARACDSTETSGSATSSAGGQTATS